MGYHDKGTSWFIAQFKPNSHSIAARNLIRQGFRIFLPLQEITKGVRGNFVTQLRPLFPGYIFVAFDIAEVGWRRVKSTHGITQLVSFGTQPTPVPLDLISQLMLRCDHEGKLLPPKLLRLNDQVMLNTGPFADYVGTIEAIAPDRRIWVLMEIMGRQTRVSVTAASVRAACH